MPLPMVHLSIAMQVCEKLNIIPSAQLLLGSIAPDAIHMRTNVGREDKDVTHFRDKPELDRLKRVKSMYESYQKREEADFIKGYCIHLLTDFYWVDTIIQNFEKNLPEGYTKNERQSLYYLETDQIDFNLYRNMPWRPEVWQSLQGAIPMDMSPLLTAAEISLWRDRVVDWFDKIKQEPKIVPQYITDSMVDGFMAEASSFILDQLFEIHSI